ncbi:hypothetical protein F4560_000791 [Saccharothrix ecbatanensis]|uniref:Excreted virulence factor EspC (Type VII ESX diderm) n=1 Tax=Saccharothrix ecbatanensis TaxID=1105145 RepID=A0A7W9HFJ0_9PSEU|nr:hypothetical protein [Saccharothrix ecbatanensis]MBB5801023.1 hypothetical protein [Saccharothrix ecbatanensis]
MDDGYSVVTEALTSHARGLDELGDELRAAADTAQTMLTGDALGQAGTEFTTSVALLVRAAQQAMASGNHRDDRYGDQDPAYRD